MDDEHWIPDEEDEDEIMREYEQHNQGDNFDNFDLEGFENDDSDEKLAVPAAGSEIPISKYVSLTTSEPYSNLNDNETSK